jgi:hypothetical protein
MGTVELLLHLAAAFVMVFDHSILNWEFVSKTNQ